MCNMPDFDRPCYEDLDFDSPDFDGLKQSKSKFLKTEMNLLNFRKQLFCFVI